MVCYVRCAPVKLLNFAQILWIWKFFFSRFGISFLFLDTVVGFKFLLEGSFVGKFCLCGLLIIYSEGCSQTENLHHSSTCGWHVSV